MFKAAEVLPAN